MPSPINKYLNVRQAYGASVRSDGEKVAFLTNITGVSQVWQTELNQGDTIPWPEQLTFTEDRIMGAWFSPAPGDSRMIFSQDVGGNENAQLFMLDDQDLFALTAGFEKALHFLGGWLSDGSGFYFAANRGDAAQFDIYIQRLGAEAERVWHASAPGFPIWQSMDSRRNRSYFNVMQSSSVSTLQMLDLDTGEVRTLGQEAGRLTDVNVALDGSLYLLGDLESDFVQILRCTPDSDQIETVAAFEWDAVFLDYSPDGRKLAFTVNQGGYRIPHVLDIASGAVQAAFQPNPSAGAAGQLDDEGHGLAKLQNKRVAYPAIVEFLKNHG